MVVFHSYVKLPKGRRVLVLEPLLRKRDSFHDKHRGLKTPRQNSRWLAAFHNWPSSVPVRNPKLQKSHAHTEAANGGTRKVGCAATSLVT